MSQQALRKHLQSKEVHSVYVLVGEDRNLLTEAARSIKQRVLTTAPDFNHDTFCASDVPIARVLEAAQTAPMMAVRRFVVLDDIHKIASPDAELLLKYCAAPVDSTVFCLLGSKLDQRRKLGKQLAKLPGFFKLDPPHQNELHTTIQALALEADISISEEGAHLLGDIVGPNMALLKTTLQQLATYVSPKNEIDANAVSELVANTRLRSVFELTDAVGKRDLATALLRLRHAAEFGEAPLKLLAMIARQFRILLKVRECDGKPRHVVTQHAGVPPFSIPSLQEQAACYQTAELYRALDLAAQTDTRMKSTRVNHSVALERLLVEVVG